MINRDRRAHNKPLLILIPQVIERLQETLQTEDAQPIDLLALIKIDPTLTAEVLQFAALQALKSTATCDSLESILSPVLLSKLHPLLLELASRMTGFESNPYWIEYTEQFWQQSIACAVIQESLAQQLDLNPLSAYTTGLMFKLEPFTIKQNLLASQPKYRLDNKAIQKLLFEEQNLSFTSNTTDFLQSFHFSESVCLPIKHYRDPIKAPKPHLVSAQLLQLSVHSISKIQSGSFQQSSIDLDCLNLLENISLTESLYEKACMDAYKKYRDIQLFIL